VAGAEVIVRVHVPFSLADLSQIEKCLGSFTTDPDCYVKEFQYLAQSYDLIWHDIYLILSSILLLEERQRVWDVTRLHADEIHRTTPTHPVGATAVPTEEPNWDYQTNGRMLRDQMVTCLVAELKKAARRLLILMNSEKFNKRKRKIWLVFCPDSQRCYVAIQKLTLKLGMGQSYL
jgi:hypothetical protein